MTQQALIEDQQKAQLKRTFRKDLKTEVELRLFTQRPSPIATWKSSISTPNLSWPVTRK